MTESGVIMTMEKINQESAGVGDTNRDNDAAEDEDAVGEDLDDYSEDGGETDSGGGKTRAEMLNDIYRQVVIPYFPKDSPIIFTLILPSAHC